MAQDRCHDSGRIYQHPSENCLAASSQVTGLPGGVQSILCKVQIQAREVYLQKRDQSTCGTAKRVFFIGLCHDSKNALRLFDDVAVQQRQLCIGHGICRRVEVMDVAQNETCSVPDLFIGLAHRTQNCRTDCHVTREVHRCSPEAEHVGTKRRLLLLISSTLYDGPRVDHIPNGLAHLPSIAINAEAVGHDRLVGCDALNGH
mmetsp:Transcript_65107/g.105272  ORF Transcript_65107/g.105272 Transcript_65107/m.105272 type:complete len:202 (+) Transcript_65107:631-1236(+)